MNTALKLEEEHYGAVCHRCGLELSRFDLSCPWCRGKSVLKLSPALRRATTQLPLGRTPAARRRGGPRRALTTGWCLTLTGLLTTAASLASRQTPALSALLGLAGLVCTAMALSTAIKGLLSPARGGRRYRGFVGLLVVSAALFGLNALSALAW